jgi:uncharacterized protein YecE (DUF72 family)
MILVSTSGFSYNDWVGPFYPPGTPKWEMLPFFARFFHAVELNYSYYSLPGRKGIDGFIEKAPGMKFALKAHKSFTHRREYGQKEIDAFRTALDALAQNDALLALLVQFPNSFHLSDESLDYIGSLTQHFQSYPIAVEFRHADWKNRRAFDFLDEHNLALVTTDAPDVPGLFRGGWERIGPLGYVRLHGRNAEKWYEHEHAWQRYDYSYSLEQLEKLAGAVRKLAGEEPGDNEVPAEKRDTYVFFNNHWKAQGVVNALQLRLILGEELPEDLPKEIKERLLATGDDGEKA